MQFYFLQEKKQKPKSNKKPSLYEGGVWVVSTTCIPLLVCSSIKHQPSGFSGASNIGSKQKGRCKATAIFLWQPQGGFQFFFATAITDLCTELPFC
uniref:Uncharacterized protein n=1 Tax=Populus trichocarpa TaxID=3694 RepID=A0A2K2C544_POPTR